MKPPKGYVIVEAVRGDRLPSGLITNYRQEYPQSGRVVASSAAKEDVRPGDFILINVESHDAVPTYYRVFEIVLDDAGTPLSIFCSPDVEPLFVDTIKESRSTGNEKRITLQDLMGEGFQFLASDVLTYQWAEGNSPGFSILYPIGVNIFYLNNRMYYRVHEDDILAVLEDW